MDFYMPKNNYFGVGSLERIINPIKDKEFKKCLIVTDKFMVESETFKRVINVLYKASVAWQVYDETVPNPTVENVNAAYSMIKDDMCDFIISIGGGSSHDCAKAVGILGSNGKSILDYVGVGKLTKEIVPLIAINTTAGTGSEITAFTVITDATNKVKHAIVDPKMTSWISVNDASTMVTMPAKLTAATGLDALTHAIEAYVSTNSSSITDANALMAIRLIKDYLPTAVKDGNNVVAREKMAEAQFLAGMAFSNASLGYVHGIAHQLGGIYNLPHGVCNAVLLPYVVKFNGSSSGSKFGDIAECLGKNVFNKSNKFSSKVVFDYLIKLNKELNIPIKLRDLGVKEEDFGLIAKNALLDPCSITNPVQIDEMGIISILKEAY